MYAVESVSQLSTVVPSSSGGPTRPSPSLSAGSAEALSPDVPDTPAMASTGVSPSMAGYSPPASLYQISPSPPMRSPSISTYGSPRLGWRMSHDSSSSSQPALPYTKEFVAEYRTRMKTDPDPEAQFAFAMYLIDAAKRIADPHDSPKQQRKYRDALLGESLRLIKKLATQNVAPGKPPWAEAQYFLGHCYGKGSLGLSIDHAKSYHMYVQASKQNHPTATYRTAVCNEVGAGTKRDYQRGMLFYRKAASLGDTAGMFKLGMILLYGLLDQPRQPREAIVWLRRAAGQADEDNPQALHELAMQHENPSNAVVPYDPVLARDLYTQAAHLGYSPSQCKLGDAYANGVLACTPDARTSISWYTKAANKGDGHAELALSGWYLTGAEGVLQQSDTEAYTWAQRAANKGIANAEYAVGHYTEVGIGTVPDVEEAKRWYARAAAQQHARAIQRLHDIKTNGGRKAPKPVDADCVIM